MKKVLLISALLLPGTAFSDQGCIESATTTVTTTVCIQFSCVQKAPDGSCMNWACTKTQSSAFVDAGSTGCTRTANCGKNALFVQGSPLPADEDSSEECEWYPCVQADPATHACVAFMCVSKRAFKTARTAYPGARCVPQTAAPARPAPPQNKADRPKPAPVQAVKKQKLPARKLP